MVRKSSPLTRRVFRRCDSDMQGVTPRFSSRLFTRLPSPFATTYMSSRLRERSQNWLVGQDDTLDNFFSSSASSFKSKRQAGTSASLKRKRAGDASTRKNASSSKKVTEEALEKRAKLHGTKDTNFRQSSIIDSVQAVRRDESNSSGSKGKARAALDDVTTYLQNSPHRRSVKNNRHMKQSLFRTSPSRRKGNIERNEDGRFVEDSLTEEDDDDDDTPLRLRSPKAKQTPSHASKSGVYRMKGALPTPPASSAPDSGRTYVNRRDSSPISTLPLAEKNNEALLLAKTPFTFTCGLSKQSYPTPSSVAVPRLSFALPGTEKLPAPSLDMDSDSSLASLSSSSSAASASPSAPQAEIDEDVEERVAENDNNGHEEPPKNKSKPFAFVPSSQTQYIHYSPTRKNKGGRTIEFPDVQFKQPSLTMIPSSQSQLSQSLILPAGSQSSHFSPRITRKPVPLFTHGLLPPSPSKDGQGKPQSAALNFVVPTSQEDEMEISLLNGAAPPFSQLVGDSLKAVAARGSEEEL